ncbi:MAG: hypothetical protein H6719_36710 [Sandaracinaceae bacterium]|nr:hypothetical protein [Sandaracinaceae bacterium]
MTLGARPALYLGSRGLAFAWHGPLGPMVARYDTWSREQPSLVRGLGHPGADLPVTPEPYVTSAGLVVVWCEEDGAWASCLDLEGGAEDGPRLVLPGAARIAVAPRAEGATLFGADELGIQSVELDARGAPLREPARRVTETRAPATLSAASLRDEGLCVAVHTGDPEWTALSVRDGAGATVRHRHRRPVDDARVRSVGGRAAVLLTSDAEIELALVGPGGKVIERPHTVFPVGTGRLAWPDAVWVDDHWVVLARDVEAGVLRAHPLSPKGTAFTFPRCDGAFAAAYRSQAYYALEIEPKGDDAELRLFRCGKTGEQQQQRVDTVPNPDARALHQRRAIRRSLAALADQLRRARGYRDSALRPALGREGSTLELVDDRGRLTVSARPDPEEGVSLRVASALGEEAELEAAPSSLVRLAAWVRRRFSAAAREALEARRAWAEALAVDLGARLEGVERAGTTVVLDLHLDALPHAEALQSWLRRLRDAQTDGP